MLTEILVGALSNMDYDTLEHVLESCSEEELAFVDEAMEATTEMTAKDKEDFDFINKVQRQASSKDGWAGVDKADRDKFVDIMTKTKNLKVLKKAAKLGEKEATHDSRVKNALSMIGFSGAGALIGNVPDSRHINSLKDDAYNKLKTYAYTMAQYDNASLKRKIYEDEYKKVDGIDPEKSMAAWNKMVKADQIKFSRLDDALQAKRDLDAANIKLDNYGHPATIIGGLAGAGVGAAINAAKKGIKNARDLKALKAQGEDMTPDQRWKAARKRAGK